MDLKLDGKVALVTGSTAGIGLAIAQGLAHEGARIIVNGRTEQRVAAAKQAIISANSAASVETYAGDLSRPEVADALVKRFDTVDILVNNLGAYTVKPFEDLADEDWRALIETNFMSGVRLSRHYLPRMKQAGWGRIIFISS